MSIEYIPNGINIELTTRCPLRCPQCYCTLEGGKDIPAEAAIKALEEAARLGVEHVELSGGETMCYPHLYEVVAAARRLGIAPSIAISGWHFDEEALDKLVSAGIDMICVSLNGPTETDNAETRDGYQYAIDALELLQKKQFPNTMINWVMHRNSVAKLPDMIALAQKYEVGGIIIIDPKPTSEGKLDTYPTLEQMKYVAGLAKRSHGNVELIIQHCFSSLLALSCDNKLWGNTNRGLYKGCTAALCSYCIDVDGQFTPCRHLNYPEKWSSAEEYWTRSEILRQLRQAEDQAKDNPCADCRLCNYCRPCPALNDSSDGHFRFGSDACPLSGAI